MIGKCNNGDSKHQISFMKEGKETVVGSVVFDCAAAALTKLDLYVPCSSYGLYEEVLSVRVCTLNDTAGDGKSMRRSAGFPGISCCWQSKI